MLVRLTYYKKGSKSTEAEHFLHLPEGADIVKEARAYVTGLNADLAGFQLPYVLLGAGEYHLPDPSLAQNHRWEKTSPIGMTDSAGGYHHIKCAKCGITGRQYTTNIHPTVDPQYLAKKYQNCATVIRTANKKAVPA